MRTVYLGTSEFAVTVLARLAETEHRPALVVTRPDRPSGRGRRLQAPPVARAAQSIGIDLFQPEDVNDASSLDRISAAAPEALIVCAFGAMIRSGLLEAHPILNVHPSLLPRWRGAAPIERAIMAGDHVSGVCIIELTAGLDSGPVLIRAEEPIAAEDDYGTLSARLAEAGAQLLVEALNVRPPARPQVDEGVTYAEKISAEDRRLDPGRPAAELERVVRALHPHIGARLVLEGEETLGVLQARVSVEPANGLDLSGEWPRLGTAEGSLELLRVQPAGRGAMSGQDFLRGRRR